MDNSRSQFTMKLLVTGTTHPISLREKLTFLHSAAFCTLGSQLPFAGCSSSGYYADKVNFGSVFTNVRCWRFAAHYTFLPHSFP
mgnify:FL=1